MTPNAAQSHNSKYEHHPFNKLPPTSQNNGPFFSVMDPTFSLPNLMLKSAQTSNDVTVIKLHLVNIENYLYWQLVAQYVALGLLVLYVVTSSRTFRAWQTAVLNFCGAAQPAPPFHANRNDPAAVGPKRPNSVASVALNKVSLLEDSLVVPNRQVGGQVRRSPSNPLEDEGPSVASVDLQRVNTSGTPRIRHDSIQPKRRTIASAMMGSTVDRTMDPLLPTSLTNDCSKTDSDVIVKLS